MPSRLRPASTTGRARLDRERRLGAGLNLMLSVDVRARLLSQPDQRPDAVRSEQVPASHAGHGQRATPARSRPMSCGTRKTWRGKRAQATSTRRRTCRCSRPATTAIKAGDPTRHLPRRAEPHGATTPGRVDGRPGVPEALYAINDGEAKNYFDVLGGAPERLLQSAGLHPDDAAVQPVGRLEQRSELLRLLPL